MLQRGDAGGVFQFEGQGMRDVLRQMRPDRFEDLIAVGGALSARADGEHPRLLPTQAWRGAGQPPHPELARHPGRDLRHHGVPGTGHADRPEDGRLQPGRRRPAAPRDGQEDPRRDGGAARRSSSPAPRLAASMPRRRLSRCSSSWPSSPTTASTSRTPRPTPGRLPDGVDEGEPSGRVHGRLHVPGPRQHRPARGAQAGGGAHGARRCCRPTSTGPGRILPSSAGGRRARDPLRACGSEEGRLRRHAGA